MATVKDIYNFIDSFAPFSTQAEWDNSGLLVGNENNTVNKIIFALDVTLDVIEQAKTVGADLIVTHHPVIFKPVSSVLSDSLIYKIIENNMSIICAHTSYDKAVDGVNDILCYTVGADVIEKIDDTFLNVAIYNNTYSTDDIAKHFKEKLNCVVRYNNLNKNINKLAVCSGSGSDYLSLAKEMGCDGLLTGDASHHSFLDADEMGIVLFACGHFETEMIAIKPLLEKINNEFDVECVLAKQSTPIMTI
jgi:dinuclear metal center YbgI/SA1388 family protein